MGPGIKPTTSWLLVGLVSTATQWELPLPLILIAEEKLPKSLGFGRVGFSIFLFFPKVVTSSCCCLCYNHVKSINSQGPWGGIGPEPPPPDTTGLCERSKALWPPCSSSAHTPPAASTGTGGGRDRPSTIWDAARLGTLESMRFWDPSWVSGALMQPWRGGSTRTRQAPTCFILNPQPQQQLRSF